MSKDYYKILGVQKNAGKEEIKKAFYALAQKFHPDKKGGDEAKFKEINEAYQILSDDNKKAQYDRFGSAGSNGFDGGGQAGQGFGDFDFGGFAQKGGFQFNGQEIDLEDLFGSFGFGGRRVRRGRDIQVQVALTFEESVRGVTKKISTAHLSNIEDTSKKRNFVEVPFPAGISHGEAFALPGLGEQISGGNPGDLYVIARVTPHPRIRREGWHLVIDIDVKISDALLGATYRVETLDGKLDVEIPTGLQAHEVLRVKGKGIQGKKQGDLLLQTHLVIPKKLNKEQRKIVEDLKKSLG